MKSFNLLKNGLIQCVLIGGCLAQTFAIQPWDPHVGSQKWLADFVIGDKDPGSDSENGMYKVAYSEIAQSLGWSGSSWFRIDQLHLVTGSIETLSYMPKGLISPNQLKSVPFKVIDKNENDVFDNGDSLFFYAHGTGFWKKNPIGNNSISADYP